MSLRGWKLTLSRKVQAQSREEALGMAPHGFEVVDCKEVSFLLHTAIGDYSWGARTMGLFPFKDAPDTWWTDGYIALVLTEDPPAEARSDRESPRWNKTEGFFLCSQKACRLTERRGLAGWPGTQEECVFLDSGVAVDVRYLPLLEGNDLRCGLEREPVLVYREGRLVAVVMPVRQP